MTSATDNRTTELINDRVNRLLHEAGADFTVSSLIRTGSMEPFDKFTVFDADKMPTAQIETSNHNGETVLLTLRCTPEQAIAATLGRPKVKKVSAIGYDPQGGEYEYLACSGCGEWIDGDLDCIGEYDGPNFCNNCGGEFDGPLLCECGKLADLEHGGKCVECYWYEGEGNDG